MQVCYILLSPPKGGLQHARSEHNGELEIMIRINEDYLKLGSSYLFSEIARRVTAFQAANQDRKVIKLGIGDVTLPLPQACIRAMHEAVDEMAAKETFRGYGPGRDMPSSGRP
jgi:hypothetical protein